MSTSSKVLKTNVKKEKDYLYFLSENNQICRLKMTPDGPIQGTAPETVECITMTREKGFMYFIDEEGDISRVKVIV